MWPGLNPCPSMISFRGIHDFHFQFSDFAFLWSSHSCHHALRIFGGKSSLKAYSVPFWDEARNSISCWHLKSLNPAINRHGLNGCPFRAMPLLGRPRQWTHWITTVRSLSSDSFSPVRPRNQTTAIWSVHPIHFRTLECWEIPNYFCMTSPLS